MAEAPEIINTNECQNKTYETSESQPTAKGKENIDPVNEDEGSGRLEVSPGPDTESPVSQTQPENVEKTKRSPTMKLTLFQSTKLIERRKTLLSLIVPNETLFKVILNLYKHQITTAIISVLWLICNMNFLSICFGHQLISHRIYVPMQLVFTANFCLHHSVFIRVGIIKELAKSFNFWFTMWNVISFHICAFFLWGFSINIFSTVVHSISSMFVLIFMDAHSAKHLPIIRSATFIGLLSYTPVVIVLLFRLTDFRHEKFFYSSTGIEIIDVRLQALDNVVTLIIYLLRIIYTHNILKKPNSIAFLSHFYEIDHNKSDYNIANNQGTYENNTSQTLSPTEVRECIAESGPSRHAGHEKQFESKNTDTFDSINISEQSEGINSRHHNSNPSQSEWSWTRRKVLPLDDPEQPTVANHTDNHSFLIIGILETKTIEYDLHRTIFHRHIVPHYPRLMRILKSKYYNLLGMATCVVATLFSFPLAIGVEINDMFIHLGAANVIMSILFISIQMFTVCNSYMVNHMLHSFDFWYVMWLSAKTFVSSGTLCGWDIRMVFWLFSLLIAVWSIMVDTFTLRSRVLSYFSILGAVCSFSAAVVCKLNAGNIYSTDRYLRLGDISPMSSRITISSSMFSLTVFFCRFCWSYHRNQKRILFITENITVKDVSAR